MLPRLYALLGRCCPTGYHTTFADSKRDLGVKERDGGHEPEGSRAPAASFAAAASTVSRIQYR